MPTLKPIHPGCLLANHLRLLLIASLWLTGVAQGQVKQDQSVRVATAIARLQQGNFGLVNVEDVARAGAVQAIPVLKQQFERSHDEMAKGKIAGALVRLGEPSSAYWGFLQKLADEAVDSDVPYPGSFDEQGKIIARTLSPGFEAWARSHQVSTESASQIAEFELPGKLELLAETGDARGLTILRHAMSSPNYFIEAVAAKGLVKLRDNDSIPLMIAACKGAPSAAAAWIAEALVFVDNADAQSAADVYLPKDYAIALRQAKQVPGNDVFLH